MIKKKREFVWHLPTGAFIPVNPKYELMVKEDQSLPIAQIEDKVGRRYFTLDSICNRWNYDFEYVMKLLGDYEIPVFSFGQAVNKDGSVDTTNIRIFQEYILSLEKKLKIPHKKIKSQKLEFYGDH